MRDTKRFVSRKNNPLVDVICPECGGKLRISLARLDDPAICLYCNAVVEQPAEHRQDSVLDKLKIPLKGSIITESGTIDLENVEAESDAYTGGRNAFERQPSNPAEIMAEMAANRAGAADAVRPGSQRHTAKFRAVKYSVIKIALFSLVAAGLVVFVWQMIAFFGKSS